MPVVDLPSFVLGFDDATILIRARLLTRDLKGTAWLSANLTHRGENSMSLQEPSPPTFRVAEWQTRELRLRLPRGEPLDGLIVGVGLQGEGSCALDDVRVYLGPRWEDLGRTQPPA